MRGRYFFPLIPQVPGEQLPAMSDNLAQAKPSKPPSPTFQGDARQKPAQTARSDRTNFRTQSPHGKCSMFACKTEYSGKGGKRITHRPFDEGCRKTCVEPAFFVILKAERAALDFVSRFASRSDENSPLRTTEDCNPAFDNPDCSQ